MTGAELLSTALVSAISGGVFGSAITAFFSRRADKKQPKTLSRAEAYEEFVAFILASDQPTDFRSAEFARIKGRIMVFGESEVVRAVESYLKTINGSQQTVSSTHTSLEPVIIAMRKSLLTGHRSMGPTLKGILGT